MKEWILGLDVSVEHTSYCYYDEAKQEAVNGNSQERYNPYANALFYATVEGRWYFSEEAKQIMNEKDGFFYEDIIARLASSDILIQEEKTYQIIDLAALLFRHQLKKVIGDDMTGLKSIVITMKSPHKRMLKVCEKLAALLGLHKQQVNLMSYQNAAVYYVLKQEPSIWNNGVGILAYDFEGLHLARMTVNRQVRPMRVTFQKEALNGMPALSDSPSAAEKDEALYNVCKSAFSGRGNVSGIYLLGEGFEQEFIHKAANELCRGRRVFVGQNMYAQGACLAAYHGPAMNDGKNGVILLAKGMIHYDIGVRVRYRGKDEIAPVAIGGMEWFQTSGTACVYLNDTCQLEIDLIHRLSNHVIQERIDVKGLPNRPPRTTKLLLQAEYVDETHGVITIRDKGFGDMYPSTQKVYRKEFVIGD